MRTDMAIIAGGAVLALGMFLSVPRYSFTAVGHDVVRMDSRSGKLSYCFSRGQGVGSYQDGGRYVAFVCSPWGEEKARGTP